MLRRPRREKAAAAVRPTALRWPVLRPWPGPGGERPGRRCCPCLCCKPRGRGRASLDGDVRMPPASSSPACVGQSLALGVRCGLDGKGAAGPGVLPRDGGPHCCGRHRTGAGGEPGTGHSVPKRRFKILTFEAAPEESGALGEIPGGPEGRPAREVRGHAGLRGGAPELERTWVTGSPGPRVSRCSGEGGLEGSGVL